MKCVVEVSMVQIREELPFSWWASGIIQDPVQYTWEMGCPEPLQAGVIVNNRGETLNGRWHPWNTDMCVPFCRVPHKEFDIREEPHFFDPMHP